MKNTENPPFGLGWSLNETNKKTHLAIVSLLSQILGIWFLVSTYTIHTYIYISYTYMHICHALHPASAKKKNSRQNVGCFCLRGSARNLQRDQQHVDGHKQGAPQEDHNGTWAKDAWTYANRGHAWSKNGCLFN